MLDNTKAAVKEERSSKRPFSDAEARALLKSVDQVILAKGKASRTLKAAEAKLDDLRGPTGSFRAPMVRKGKTLLVGFSAEGLGQLLA